MVPEAEQQGTRGISVLSKAVMIFTTIGRLQEAGIEAVFGDAVVMTDEGGGIAGKERGKETSVLRTERDKVGLEVHQVDMAVGETQSHTVHHGDRQLCPWQPRDRQIVQKLFQMRLKSKKTSLDEISGHHHRKRNPPPMTS